MRNSRFVPVLLVLGLCVALTSPALAIQITNITTGGSAILFEDDFEGISPACTTVLGGDAGDYDPSPSVGLYTITETNPSDLQVCSGSDGDDLGPFEGNNYMRMTRVSSMSTYAVFDQAATSGMVHIETMLGLVDLSGSTPRSGPLGLMNDGTLGVYFLLEGDGSVKNYVGGYQTIYYDSNYQYTTSSSATLLSYTQDQWQKFVLDYTLGASTYSLSIDDVTVMGIPVNSALISANQVRILAGSPNDGSTLYLDHVAEVPEPGTIAMLIAGVLAGVCFFRRRK